MKQHHYAEHGEKLGVESVACDYCGEQFERETSELERTSRNFCDNECFGKWQSEKQIGEDNPMWSGGKRRKHTCEVCGSEYTNYKPDDETKCCSRECYTELLMQKTGEEAFAWKGGREKYYGSNWQEQRRKAIEEAGSKCEKCGIPREEYRGESGEDLHVHHQKRFKAFDEAERANRLDNLMVLCRDCHYDEEYNRNN